MLNQMTILKGEKLLAGIIAERDGIIEGLVEQVDQMAKQADQLRQEIHRLNAQAAGKEEAPCQDQEPSPTT